MKFEQAINLYFVHILSFVNDNNPSFYTKLEKLTSKNIIKSNKKSNIWFTKNTF